MADWLKYEANQMSGKPERGEVVSVNTDSTVNLWTGAMDTTNNPIYLERVPIMGSYTAKIGDWVGINWTSGFPFVMGDVITTLQSVSDRIDGSTIVRNQIEVQQIVNNVVENLIINSGFELDTGWTPAQCDNFVNANPFKDTTNFVFGNKCLSWTVAQNTSTGYVWTSQMVNSVLPDTEYCLSFFYRDSLGFGNTLIHNVVIEQYDSDGNNDILISGATITWNPPLNTSWSRYTNTFTTAPTTKKVKIYIKDKANQTNATWQCWYDGVQLEIGKNASIYDSTTASFEMVKATSLAVNVNLLPNSSFEYAYPDDANNLLGWVMPSGIKIGMTTPSHFTSGGADMYAVRDTTKFADESVGGFNSSLKITTNNVKPNNYIETDQFIAVNGNDYYTVSGFFNVQNVPATNSVYMSLLEYKSDTSLLQETPLIYTNILGGTAGDVNGFQQFYQATLTDKLTAYVKVRIYAKAVLNGTNTLWIDNVQFQRGQINTGYSPKEIIGTQIAQNSISTPHIITNSITSDLIQAKALKIGHFDGDENASLNSSYYTNFQNLNNWRQIAGSGSATPMIDSTAYTTDNIVRASGYVWMEGQNIPFDPDVLYRVTARVRKYSQPTRNPSVYASGSPNLIVNSNMETTKNDMVFTHDMKSNASFVWAIPSGGSFTFASDGCTSNAGSKIMTAGLGDWKPVTNSSLTVSVDFVTPSTVPNAMSVYLYVDSNNYLELTWQSDQNFVVYKSVSGTRTSIVANNMRVTQKANSVYTFTLVYESTGKITGNLAGTSGDSITVTDSALVSSSFKIGIAAATNTKINGCRVYASLPNSWTNLGTLSMGAISTSTKYAGSQSAKIYVPQLSNGGLYQDISIAGNKVYLLSAYLNITNVGGSGKVQMKLQSYNSSGTLLTEKNNTLTAITGGWTRYNFYHATHIDTSYLRVYVYAENATFYVDNIMLEDITSQNHSMYVGVNGVKSDGVTYESRLGANSYWSQYFSASANQFIDEDDGWTTVTGYIKGKNSSPVDVHTDPTQPDSLRPAVKYIRPMFILNYNDTSNTEVMDIDSYALEIMEFPDAIIDSAKIKDLSADKINTGTLGLGMNGILGQLAIYGSDQTQIVGTLGGVSNTLLQNNSGAGVQSIDLQSVPPNFVPGIPITIGDENNIVIGISGNTIKLNTPLKIPHTTTETVSIGGNVLDTLDIRTRLSAPNVMLTHTSPSTMYVDCDNGSDNNMGTKSSPFKTLSYAISTLKKCLVVNVFIYAWGTSNENPIYIQNFIGGEIYIRGYHPDTLQPLFVKGGFYLTQNTSRINFQSSDSGTRMKVMGQGSYPPLFAANSDMVLSQLVRWDAMYTYDFAFQGYNCKIYGYNSTFTGANHSAVFLSNNSHGFIWNCDGNANQCGIFNTEGSTCVIAGTIPVGASSGNSVSGANAPFFGSGTGAGNASEQPGGQTPPTQTTSTWMPIWSETWRDANGGWRGTSHIYQGRTTGQTADSYINYGCWWYGSSAQNTLAGKTIISATLRLSREVGGYNSKVNPRLWGLNINGTSAGSPKNQLLTDYGYLTAMNVGDVTTHTLDNGAVSNYIAKGLGLCLYDSYSGYSIYYGYDYANDGPLLSVTYK